MQQLVGLSHLPVLSLSPTARAGDEAGAWMKIKRETKVSKPEPSRNLAQARGEAKRFVQSPARAR